MNEEFEMNDFVSKLQALLSQLDHIPNSRVATSEVVKETCSYIRRLQREIDDLSERLSRLLDANPIALHVDTLIALLQQ